MNYASCAADTTGVAAGVGSSSPKIRVNKIMPFLSSLKYSCNDALYRYKILLS